MATYPFGIAVTHYETLGVVDTASAEEIHAAYKRLARRVHPDAGGSASQMATVNEAYRVLSDPGRRALYDASRRAPVSSAGGGSARFHSGSFAEDTSDDDVDFAATAPWKLRVPFWSLLLLGTLFAMFLFTAYAGSSRTPAPKLPTVDGVLAINECVVMLGADAHAEEVPCGGRRDGVVVSFLAVEQKCPTGLVGLRRTDAAGVACIMLG